MNKKFSLAIASLLLFSGVSQASVTDKFVGTFDLVKSEDKGTFCYDGIVITSDGNTMSLYRKDMQSYGALYSAEVNGTPRQVKHSHGEALSSLKGQDTVSFLNNTLTFSFKGRQSVAGIPAIRITDSISIKMNADKKTLQVERRSTEGPVAGIGRKDSASCVYVKQ